MAEHEVRVQVPAGFDYIGTCGICPVAGLSRKTVAAAKSAYAETTCKNTCEHPMADHGTSACYGELGFEKAELPYTTGTYRHIS